MRQCLDIGEPGSTISQPCSPFCGLAGPGSVCFRWVLVLWLMAIGGCRSPERDLLQDPHNNPLVHMLEAGYEPASGAVSIRWEYIGDQPVTQFLVQRQWTTQVFSIGTVAGSVDLQVGTFRDTTVIAGETMFYRVVAETASGGTVQTPLVPVDVPGAPMRGVQRDPVGLAVQILWGQSEGAAAYEVIRRVGEGPEVVIYTTQDPLISFFWDEAPVDNDVHAYYVLTTLSSGIRLKSAEAFAQFYRLIAAMSVESFPDPRERMVLATGSGATGGRLLALLGRSEQLSIAQFKYEIGQYYDGSPRALRTLVANAPVPLTGISPASVGLAGPPLLAGDAVFPRLYVGGLDAQTGRVVVRGYQLPQMGRFWNGPSGWETGHADGRVALAVDASRRIYVAADGEMRVFTENLSQVGGVDLNGGVPAALLAGQDVVWVAWPEDGRLERGTLTFTGGILVGAVWSDVALPSGAKPLALTQNEAQQVFVLDAARQRVIGFTSAGVQTLSWDLPAGDYIGGSLAIEAASGGLLHVSNSNGEVLTYLP